MLFAQVGPIPRARRQHGDLSGSCCCSLLSARAVAARLAIRPSIIRCIVEHRSAVSMGLAICSIIHSAAAAALAVDQVRVPSFVARPGQRVHSRQAVVGHRSGLSCAAVRVEAPFGQVPQCIGVWRLGCGGPVHLVSYLFVSSAALSLT